MKVINRTEVIDYLKEYKDLFNWDDGGREKAALTRIFKDISNMPYIETHSFKWCTNCKEYDQENYCCHRWSNVIRNTVEENREYLEQVKWERDLAVKQLKDLGYRLGEKPRVGKWIKDIERFGDNAYHCSQCGAVLEKDDLEWRNNYYCYHCGVDMRGGQDDSISN